MAFNHRITVVGKSTLPDHDSFIFIASAPSRYVHST